MTELTLVKHIRSGKTFLAYSRKLPWKGNDIAWFRPMKFLGFTWEKVYNKKDIEVVGNPWSWPTTTGKIIVSKGAWE